MHITFDFYQLLPRYMMSRWMKKKKTQKTKGLIKGISAPSRSCGPLASSPVPLVRKQKLEKP